MLFHDYNVNCSEPTHATSISYTRDCTMAQISLKIYPSKINGGVHKGFSPRGLRSESVIVHVHVPWYVVHMQRKCDINEK